MEKEDRRIRKTKKTVLDVFLKLLGEKSIHEISPGEIAQLADISRSTFYLHYADVYDLLNQAEDAVFEEIAALVDGYSYETLLQDPLLLFTDLFHYFARNSKICVLLLSRSGSITTGKRISRMIEAKLIYEWEILVQADDPQTSHYLSQYIISGFVGILQSWMENGCTESAEEMAALTRAILSASIPHENYEILQKEGADMSLKQKVRESSREYVSGILGDTSTFIQEKSVDIQQKVANGLAAAGGILQEKSVELGTPADERAAEKLQKKILKRRQELEELEEKHREKLQKLEAERKEKDLENETRKYNREKERLEQELAALVEPEME